jgi:hypothetical protein
MRYGEICPSITFVPAARDFDFEERFLGEALVFFFAFKGHLLML